MQKRCMLCHISKLLKTSLSYEKNVQMILKNDWNKLWTKILLQSSSQTLLDFTAWNVNDGKALTKCFTDGYMWGLEWNQWKIFCLALSYHRRANTQHLTWTPSDADTC